MNVRRTSFVGAVVAFAALVVAGCRSEGPIATDEMIDEAVADATEKGFNVTSFRAHSDDKYDDYNDKDNGYVRLQVVFGTGGCIGTLDYHEEGDEIVLEVERAVLGSRDEIQALTVFGPTVEMLEQNAALTDCFVAN